MPVPYTQTNITLKIHSLPLCHNKCFFTIYRRCWAETSDFHVLMIHLINDIDIVMRFYKANMIHLSPSGSLVCFIMLGEMGSSLSWVKVYCQSDGNIQLEDLVV